MKADEKLEGKPNIKHTQHIFRIGDLCSSFDIAVLLIKLGRIWFREMEINTHTAHGSFFSNWL